MRSDYQVFISFKNSDDETEEETLDKKIAYKIYKYLTDRGLNVFFSPVTLKALGRDSWSEEIDIALKQSKVFIAVGTQKEYMNAKWVKEERTKFFGLKLNDKSRAIYGYIAPPMTLKDLPDDMGKLEVFQDRRAKELIRLYTYILNHLARVKQGDLEVEKVNNKNYFWIGLLIVFGIFFYNLNLTDGNTEDRLEDKKKIISAKESLIEVLKEERLEDKKIIKEKEEERKKDKELIAFLLTKLKDHPNYDEIVEESKKIEKSKGTKAVINYLRSIDLDDYQRSDVVEKDDSQEDVTLKHLKSLGAESNITDFNISLNQNQVINSETSSSNKTLFEDFDYINLTFEIMTFYAKKIYIREKEYFSGSVPFNMKSGISLSVEISKHLLRPKNRKKLTSLIYRKLRREALLSISKHAISVILKYLATKEKGFKIAIWNTIGNQKYKNRLILRIENIGDTKVEERITISLINDNNGKEDLSRKYTFSVPKNSNESEVDVSDYFEKLSIKGEKTIQVESSDSLIITPNIDKVFIFPLGIVKSIN